MSTEPKESADVFVFIAANPDKLAKAQKHVPRCFFYHFDQKLKRRGNPAWIKRPDPSEVGLLCSVLSRSHFLLRPIIEFSNITKSRRIHSGPRVLLGPSHLAARGGFASAFRTTSEVEKWRVPPPDGKWAKVRQQAGDEEAENPVSVQKRTHE